MFIEEFPGSAPGTVRFSDITCCALERAFEKNPEVAKQLENATTSSHLKLFKEILHNSLDPENHPTMKFIPSMEMKVVYSQLAKRELERIDAEDEDQDDISCGHSVEEHIFCLREVIEKMEPHLN